ncbi:PKD domain-containing protein [Chitinophaga sp. Cy-1792]|uniref:PKD domain-containing protein n=1 Tax=Chitinophaga sp. Cy-1792 TaxID=2608339 RepID=UPI001424726E|nr:PKD domain-containing protein [Chitinophaga sp. Cy-1792]NIG53288.1 PKD domain-containing protein [Chitinophaga sp. Cy-1792]
MNNLTYTYRKIIAICVILMLSISKIYAQNVSIKADNTSGCSPMLVSFSATADPGYTSIVWDFDQGATVKDNLTPQKTYSVPKTYHVKVTAVYPTGTIEKTLDIVVHDNPTAIATGTVTDVCQHGTLSFTDNSSTPDGTIKNISWDFGDGTFADGTQGGTISHKFDYEGTYNVGTIVTNNWGCRSNSSPIAVTVRAADEPTFTAVKTGSCTTPFDVTFINTTRDPNKVYTYTYDYGDGTTGSSPQHTYTKAGSYTVSLKAFNGSCQAATTKKNYITVGGLKAAFEYHACLGEDVVFTNTTQPTPTSSIWTFDDGTVQRTDNAVKRINYQGSMVTLSVTLDGCTDVISVPVTLNPLPTDLGVANPAKQCAMPVTTQFTTQNSNAATWLWNFGDGTTSTLQNPTHTFTQNKNYPVTLTATSAEGCSVTNTVSADYSLPGLTIQPDQIEGCIPLDVKFTAISSTTPEEPFINFTWDFGDGGTAVGTSALHTFTTEGYHTVTLTGTTLNGCKVTTTTMIQSGFKPVVDFVGTPLVSCAKDPIQFTNKSTPPGQRWLWQFVTDQDDPRNPGSTFSSEENPSHTFHNFGMQTITLTVFNYGCQNELTKVDYISINPPIAEWATTVDCDNNLFRQFTDNSRWGNDPSLPKNYSWDFGDKTPLSTDPNPSHTYAQQGIYDVTLSINNGVCDNTYKDRVYIVTQLPVIKSANAAVCVGTDYSVNVSITDPALEQQFAIYWGDGAIDGYSAWNTNYTHTYSTPGQYQVQVVATDQNGCLRKSNIENITINGAIPKFQITGKPCRDEDITFTDLSTVNSGNQLTKWVWNFGDYSAEETKTTGPANTTHQYVNDGYYQVTLNVTDKNNCTVMAVQNYILDTHKADFVLATEEPCLNQDYQYYNASTNANSFQWDFGDGTSSTDANPVKGYAAAGSYTVKLITTTANGCTDTATQKLRVPDPKADFSMPATLAPCPPAKVVFTNNSTDFATTKWDFGDGSFTANDNPDGHNYTKAGTYNIVLTVYTSGGCSSTTTQTMKVDGPDGTMSFTPNQGCAPLDMQMSAVATKTVSYAWDFDDGVVEKTTVPVSPNHTYTTKGIFYPRVILTDDKGCAVPATSTDRLIVDKAVADFDIDNSAACGGGQVIFLNKSNSLTEDSLALPYSSSWDFGRSGLPNNNSINRNGVFNYPTPGASTVKLTVVSAYGCTAEKQKNLTIPTQPKANVSTIPDICQYATATITGSETAGVPNAKWLWNIAPDINNNTTAPISFVANTGGIIPVSLTITNEDGSCPSTALSQINVHVSPSLAPTPDQINICRGNPILLMANTDADATVTWTNYNIDNASSKTPQITPDIDTTYTVVATNPYGCTNTKSVHFTVTQPFTVTTSNYAICHGTGTFLQASGAYRYQWAPAPGLSNTSIPNPLVKPEISTDYVVSGFDKFNCFEVKATSHVTVNPTPIVNAGPDLTASTGSILPLAVTGSEDITQVRWTPQADLSCYTCLNPTATPKNDVTYFVEVTNQYGCKSTDDVSIKLLCDNANIFIPNTFSPNRDGVNDIFYIRGRGVKEVRSFKIFNRWGQLLFERYNFNPDDISKGWDGTFKGQVLTPDVYVYFAEVICDKGGDGLLKGNITLLR